MDADAVIGQLYRKLAEAQQANDALLDIVRGIKDGSLPLDRIVLTETGLSLLAASATDEPSD